MTKEMEKKVDGKRWKIMERDGEVEETGEMEEIEIIKEEIQKRNRTQRRHGR